MTAFAWFQTAFFFGIVLLAVRPLGGYMARVYTGERTLLSAIFGPLERVCHRVIGIAPNREDGWATYARQLVLFIVSQLIRSHIEQRTFGILGETRVNVLRVNLSLDSLTASTGSPRP